MSHKIKGWQVNLEILEKFYRIIKESETELGRALTVDERAFILDTVAKKLPQERIEAMLENKKVLFITKETGKNL